MSDKRESWHRITLWRGQVIVEAQIFDREGAEALIEALRLYTRLLAEGAEISDTATGER